MHEPASMMKLPLTMRPCRARYLPAENQPVRGFVVATPGVSLFIPPVPIGCSGPQARQLRATKTRRLRIFPEIPCFQPPGNRYRRSDSLLLSPVVLQPLIASRLEQSQMYDGGDRRGS